ncbi:MAG: DUF4886 domain-containing protein [Oscillospiraceae bacterium]|nr:DUF4886 domain-containing protein [Oscillospiraceae bacterium]
MKKFLSSLLVIAMLLGMLVLPASAQAAVGETVTAKETVCTCGCEQPFGQVTWQPWRGNEDTNVGNGHYYLESDYVQNAQIVVNSGIRVVIDLRGHKLTTKENSRLMLVYGYASVLDTVGGGEFAAKTTGSGFGGALMIATYETSGSVFELHGGTIRPDMGSKGSRRGGLVTVGNTCTFRMYGGQILDGTTFSQLTDYADTKDSGGGIYGDTGSNIEILGGQILNCKSDQLGGAIFSKGNTVLRNCVIRGGYAAGGGGNIYQDAGSTLTVENAVISDGVCEATSGGGGNIAVVGMYSLCTIRNSTIRNGYSKYHGGNFYLGSAAKAEVEDTVMEAGVARVRGANIYAASASLGMTIRDCALPGDVACVGSNLKLEGKVTIGILNNGLRLWYADGSQSVADVSGLIEGSEIYVDANHTFTTAKADENYFKGAVRCVVSASEDGLVGTQAADGELGGYCPHCGENAVWHAFSTTDSLVQNCLDDATGDTDSACTGKHIESGHYYLTQSYTGFAQHYIGVNGVAAKDVVLDLNGKSVTCSGRLIYTRVGANSEKSEFTLLDSYGYGSVTGSGVNNQGGGILYNENAIINIYGGTLNFKLNSARAVSNGGVIYNGGELNIYGGTLDATAYVFKDNSTADKTYTYYGGAVFMATNSAKRLTMTAGRMEGGTAVDGGTLFVNYNNIVNITGGQFAGGIAKKNKDAGGAGGNIKVTGTSANKTGKLNISGVSIVGGYSESYGGNINATYFTDINVSDSYIADGETDDYGGNVSLGVCDNTANYRDCIVISGKAARGGNFYTGGTGNSANIIDCQVLYGNVTTYAGNFNVGNGKITIRGGVIQGGYAKTYGGNIACSAGKVLATNFLKLQAGEQGAPVQILGGTSGTNGGNLYNTGVAELTDAFIHNGKAAHGNDIYYAAKTSSHKNHGLAVGANLTGDISMHAETGTLSAGTYAQPLANTVCTQLNAKITLENVQNNPLLAAKNGQLYVGSVAVINAQGESAWYATNEDAVAACGADAYVKLFIDGTLDLSKDCAVDLNGHTLSVTGTYAFMGMDSASQNGADSAGKAILGQETTYTTDHFAPDGVRYLAVANGTEVTYHTMDMAITDVVLRPSSAGMYYRAVWNLDSTLKAKVTSYGIALSVESMPGSDFAADDAVLYTSMAGDSLASGVAVTSGIVDNILSRDGTLTVDGEEVTGAIANAMRGQQQIYAMPYAILEDGRILTPEEGSAMSLRQLLKALSEIVEENPEQYRRYTPDLRDFYATWKENGLVNWELEDTYAFGTPAEDDVLDILMIGNSYCYYYVEELHEMAKAAGVKMRVCNLYYSGCDMIQHYPWWQKGLKKYQYFEAVDGGKVQTNGVSMEWALMQRQWDVLSFQLSSTEMRKYTVEDSLALHREARDVLYGYLREQFPEAKLYFHQNWSYEIGHTRDDGYVMQDLAQQIAYTAHIRDIATGVCAENNVQRINTGDAWELYRAACDAAGIPHNLTARLGKNTLTGETHSGDGTHDGDIGGGQLINAAVWFEILTGVDCRENAYKPVYTYSGETYAMSDTMVEMLYDAAHKAVTEILPTYPEYNG